MKKLDQKIQLPQMIAWPQPRQIGNRPPKRIKDVKGHKIKRSLNHGLNKDKVVGNRGPNLLNLEVTVFLII